MSQKSHHKAVGRMIPRAHVVWEEFAFLPTRVKKSGMTWALGRILREVVMLFPGKLALM